MRAPRRRRAAGRHRAARRRRRRRARWRCGSGTWRRAPRRRRAASRHRATRRRRRASWRRGSGTRRRIPLAPVLLVTAIVALGVGLSMVHARARWRELLNGTSTAWRCVCWCGCVAAAC
uniref:Predicted protein n=1 Tax=Hordeum vulgare subsp. vulgare TaxID=112509 RepID=F2E943_HORVV|nr:predicted protein [Hordeum vulgare subsp. vulgare]